VNNNLGIGISATNNGSRLHAVKPGSGPIAIFETESDQFGGINIKTPVGATGYILFQDGSSTATIEHTNGNVVIESPNDTPRLLVTNDGRVGIGTTSPTDNLTISSDATQMRLVDTDNGSDIVLVAAGTGYTGGIGTTNSFDLPLFTNNVDRLTIAGESGFIGIGTSTPLTKLHIEDGVQLMTNSSLATRILIGFSDEDAGILRSYGANNSQNTYIGSWSGAPDHGLFLAFDGSNNQRAAMYSNTLSGGVGTIFLRGASGSNNVRMGSQFDYYGGDGGPETLDNGWISVLDEFSNDRAGMYIDGCCGKSWGVVYADVKNFRMNDPEDSTKEIWYASLEGPEAGAYDRGTARLESGRVFVSYSPHYTKVINPNTVTIQLTPLSADTYGLAVIEKTEKGFWVQELMGGTGDFSFDWKVEGVRAGYEDYEVIREKPSKRDIEPLQIPELDHRIKNSGIK
jgi:hypothetical protein